MRWFKTFFTTFGPAFAGAVFGAAASLKKDLANLRRYYAWKRREVSKQLIEDMKGDLKGLGGKFGETKRAKDRIANDDRTYKVIDEKNNTSGTENDNHNYNHNDNGNEQFDKDFDDDYEIGINEIDEEEDDQIDQYQFLLGSLLMLNKIEMRDIEPIMDKFRELANDEGFIRYSTAAAEGERAANKADEDSVQGNTTSEDGAVGTNMDDDTAQF